MDIEKWYTSTLARPSAKVIQKMIVESGIVFEGVDYDAASKHLGETLSMEEIVEENLEEIVYIKIKTKKDKKKKNGDITGDFIDVTLANEDEQQNKAHKVDEQYTKPIRAPTEEEFWCQD